MATYKKACVHCGNLIDGDVRFCTFCGSNSPFGYQCPTCLKSIIKGNHFCPGCGRELYVECPHCGKTTFVEEKCEHCGKSLMVKCQNRRCGEMQFFQNQKCTACGKKIKK